MLVGLYKSEFPDYQIVRDEVYKQILKYNNIDFIELQINKKDFWGKVKTLDLFLFRYAHIDDHHQLVGTVLPVIENYLNIKCFPNIKTCWHFDDKIKEYYLLKSLGYPMIDSWIFWEKEHAIDWAEQADYPVVFKLKKGAGSRNVILVKSKAEAIKIIKRMFGRGISSSYRIPHKGKVNYKSLEDLFRNNIDQYFLNKIRGIKPTIWQTEKNYVLFQRFLPNNQYDTRVKVIGKRAYGLRRIVRKNDFRASGSGNWDWNRNKIDLKFIELALKISKELQFQTMSYDFLYDERHEPSICEISWNSPDDLATGYWDENLNWHNFQFLQSFFHLKDALNMDNLRHPEMSSFDKFYQYGV